MELQGPMLPGYRVMEYMLMLPVPEQLEEKIKHLRTSFDTEFTPTHKIPGRPNVGLVQWMQYEMMEQRTMDKLRVVAMGYFPFKIELREFGSYPSHSIHINMVSKLPVQQLIKKIREDAGPVMRLNKDNKPHFLTEPHIAIARKLVPWQYEKAWLEYSRKHFTGRFIADAMLLLRRPAQDGKPAPWQIMERFEFKNLPVQVHASQGELF